MLHFCKVIFYGYVIPIISMFFVLLLSYFIFISKENPMKRTKNLKITPNTHKILKNYGEDNGLKMSAFLERIIKETCKKPKDMYGES